MSSSDDGPASLGDRFAVITDDDHTGILWIISILCLIYTLLIFMLRLEARRKNFGFDDVLAIIGTAFASIEFILIFFANNHGLGKAYNLVTSSDAEMIGKLMHGAQVLSLLALGLAKCSVISLCRRLFSSHMRSHQLFCDIAMGLCITWSVASIMAVTINCDPLHLLGYKTGFCYNLVTRWTAIGITDCVLELAIVAMAFVGLLPLQMSVSRKLQAIATFLLRLAIIVFAVFHITTLRQTTESLNPGVSMTKPIVYLQIELLYSLLSASIPALNRWLRNFDTSSGSAWMQNSSQTYSPGNSKPGGANGSSFQLQSMGRDDPEKRYSKGSMLSKKNVPKRTSAPAKLNEFVPAGPKYSVSTEVFSSSPNSELHDRPSSTGNSDDMIIRKDVQWHVQYEHDSIHRLSR